MRILPDGTVEIRNKKTGQTKIVNPVDLPSYNVPYSKYVTELEAAKKVGIETTAEIQPKESEEEKKQKRKLTDVEQSVNLMEKNLKQIEISGPVYGKLQILNTLSGGAAFPQAADYEALRKSLIGPLARAISGEVGVLTDQDISRAEGLLPKIGDAAKVRENKLKNLRELIATKKGEEPPKSEEGAKPTRGPILDFLLGSALNIAQDVGASLGQRGTGLEESQQRAIEMSQKAAQRGMAETDPETKRRLLSVGRQGLETVGQGAQQMVEEFSPDIEKGYAGRGLSAGAEIASIAGLPSFFKGVVSSGSKIIHPFRSVGTQRAAAIADATGKTVSGNKMISALEKAGANVSPTDKKSFDAFLETTKKLYKGKKLTIDRVVDLNTKANSAYSAAGKVGKSSKAIFNKALGDFLKGELKLTAPAVAEANKLFSLLFKGQKIAGKMVNPYTVGAGVSSAITGSLLYKLLRK